jgi:uncharacterized protein YwgA
LGVKFSYEFSLYLKGPYSSQLTRDYFQNSDMISIVAYPYDKVEISDKSDEFRSELDIVDRDILDSFRDVILLNSKYQEKKFELLECIATILFLIKEHHLMEDFKIKQELKMVKPYLSSPVITTGLNCVKELLFKPEFLTDEIKQEINLWDKAED